MKRLVSVLYNSKILFEIGEKIRATRDKKKLSQKELAKRLGMPASILSNIEKGKRLVPKSKIILFYKELSLKKQDIIYHIKCPYCGKEIKEPKDE